LDQTNKNIPIAGLTRAIPDSRGRRRADKYIDAGGTSEAVIRDFTQPTVRTGWMIHRNYWLRRSFAQVTNRWIAKKGESRMGQAIPCPADFISLRRKSQSRKAYELAHHRLRKPWDGLCRSCPVLSNRYRCLRIQLSPECGPEVRNYWVLPTLHRLLCAIGMNQIPMIFRALQDMHQIFWHQQSFSDQRA
jgi:hypothetical protein